MIQLNVTVDDSGMTDAKTYATGNIKLEDIGRLVQSVNSKLAELIISISMQALSQQVKPVEIIRGLRFGQMEISNIEYDKMPKPEVKEEVKKDTVIEETKEDNV